MQTALGQARKSAIACHLKDLFESAHAEGGPRLSSDGRSSISGVRSDVVKIRASAVPDDSYRSLKACGLAGVADGSKTISRNARAMEGERSSSRT